MRKIAIILCLIFASLSANAVAMLGTSDRNNNRHYIYPNYRYHQPNHYNRNYYPKRFYRNGTLTGFSPPPYYNKSNYTYWNNSSPYYSNGFTLGDKVQEFFNRKFNNKYAKNYNDPYINGNYNNIQNKRSVQFFDMDSDGNGYNIYDDYGNLGRNSKGGATVTILD